MNVRVCQGRGSNPHGTMVPRDFKTLAPEGRKAEQGGWDGASRPNAAPVPSPTATDSATSLGPTFAVAHHVEWRPVVRLEGRYEVSSGGDVRRVHDGLIPRRRPNKPGGYQQVCIACRMRFVHQLVAAAFLGPCPDGFEIDHKDGDRDHNAAANLEYVTHAENMRRYKARHQASRPPCANCGASPRTFRIVTRGRCPRCYHYLRQHGVERPTIYATGT